MTIDTVAIGELPPLGVVPKRMAAQVIRQERFGEPEHAIRLEEIEIPEIAPDEVLVAVMTAGVNFNNVWAAKGYPLDVIGLRMKNGDPYDFHIGGSEGAGIVYKTGSAVTGVSVGDEVVLHGGTFDPRDPAIAAGGDPVLSPTFRAWGFETNWGAFAQFTKVKHYQCLPKPKGLSWEEAATYILSGATIYRMLHHWTPNTVRDGDVVLIWGGAGGLGVMAIQIVKEAGGIPVAIVSSDDKREICIGLGAKGVINRNHFSHWGVLPPGDVHSVEHEAWKEEIKRFRKELTAITDGALPAIVIEHPGEATMPTSLNVCKNGGMVVTCGGTTGYTGSFDLRYLWMMQKRIQGSHFASPDECIALNRMVEQKRIRPVLSATFEFSETAHAHQLMHDNRHPYGNMAIRIGKRK